MIVQCLTWCYAILCWVMLYCVLYYAALHDIMLFFAVRFFTFCLLQKDVSFYFEDVNPVEIHVCWFLLPFYAFPCIIPPCIISRCIIQFIRSQKCMSMYTFKYTLFLSLFILCYAMLCSHNVSNDCRISKHIWCNLMQPDALWYSIRYGDMLSYPTTLRDIWYIVNIYVMHDVWCLIYGENHFLLHGI